MAFPGAERGRVPVCEGGQGVEEQPASGGVVSCTGGQLALVEGACVPQQRGPGG